ncbi:nucleoside deaminase [Rossellomorea sp. DUT-2]|uniref:nucleoside deaminase n=1 Tax=Rossellomorea sp. DUT-2 TaxID=3412021 RepID=UPI003D176961
MTMQKDRYFLELALEEAEKALSENTYPVGAVIVDENQNIISKGRNRVHPQQDTTAHAEIDAIRNAGNSIFKAKVNREKFTIYTSLEPCPMCTGGILFANIKKVVWLLNDDLGFGGYKKINDTKIFEKKFQEIEAIEEPYGDLKQKQMELMNKWITNPNHVTNLRKANIPEKGAYPQ